MKKLKEDEERLKREEEEREKEEEAREKARLEQLQLEQERKEKKKLKEKQRKERLKAEGKLLTNKQKLDRARAQAMIDALKAKGVDLPDVGEKKARPGNDPHISVSSAIRFLFLLSNDLIQVRESDPTKSSRN